MHFLSVLALYYYIQFCKNAISNVYTISMNDCKTFKPFYNLYCQFPPDHLLIFWSASQAQFPVKSVEALTSKHTE